MANIDNNSNVGVNVPSVSFTLFYDKSDETLSIHTVKVNNLQHDQQNNDLSVQFKVKDWTCKTTVKTARTSDVIWNEHFTEKIKYKHILDEEINIHVTSEQSPDIGEASVIFKDLKVDEKTVCVFNLESRAQNKASKGELIFSVRPSNDAVSLTINKAKNLPRVMREYKVVARLLSADNSEQSTSLQRTALWDEHITFKGKDCRKGVLVLQVVGEKTDERAVLGEVRVNIGDVKQREYGRILALREPKVDSIHFSTTYTQDESSSGTLLVRVFGLENIRPQSEKTYVYVQVKHKCEGVVVKKGKTSKTELTSNPSFKSNEFSFNFDNDKRNVTKFVFNVKTQKSSYTTDKPVIGKVVVGPISDGKWYREILKVKNREISHSLPLEMI